MSADTLVFSDPETIHRALALIAAPGQVVELRALEVSTGSYRAPHTVSGYFDDPAKLAAAAVEVAPFAKGVYITANPVVQALLARAANRARPVGKDATTSDKDILRRRWLLIDFDGVPVAGVSASDAEHAASLAAARGVRESLAAQGWPDPVLADSGNGAHLLYRVDLPADDGGLIERVLKGLAFRHGGAVRVDTTNHNPARIWKLYGTTARKGDHTPDRPHRLARILETPAEPQVVTAEQLAQVAGWVPEATATHHTPPSVQPAFDLDVWIRDHLPEADGPAAWQGNARRWIIPVCPWNSSHTDRSAYVIQHANGAIGAGCHHNGCQGRGWHDLRDICEPGWRTARELERNAPDLDQVFIPDAGAPASEQAHAPAPVISSEPKAVPGVTLDYTLKCHARGETGDSELLASLYADRIVFDHTERAWHIWAGHHWGRDRKASVVHLVSNDVASKYLAAAAEKNGSGDREDADELIRHASGLRANNRIRSVLELAKALPALAVTGDEWDRRADLLPLANGTIDLCTGELRPGAPRDYLRVAAPTEWRGLHAPAPRWEAFVKEIFNGDAEICAFMQRLLGYAVTGHATEHILPVFWGSEGRNGKDTLIETISAVLGPLASVVSKDVVLESARGSGGGPTPHLYALYGLRMAWVSETNRSARLDVGQVKMLTGGGHITARPLHGAPVTFAPTHLLVLITNHRPHIPPDEMAMWGRVLLVPFTQRFVDEPKAHNEHPRDARLKEKLAAEGPGILAWLVRGCLEWRRAGLRPPASVRQAVDAYRKNEDVVASFVDECCERAPGAETSVRDLHQRYMDWGGKRLDVREFGKQLVRLGFEPNTNKRSRGYMGIRLNETEADQAPIEFAEA